MTAAPPKLKLNKIEVRTFAIPSYFNYDRNISDPKSPQSPQSIAAAAFAPYSPFSWRRRRLRQSCRASAKVSLRLLFPVPRAHNYRTWSHHADSPGSDCTRSPVGRIPDTMEHAKPFHRISPRPQTDPGASINQKTLFFEAKNRPFARVNGLELNFRRPVVACLVLTIYYATLKHKAI